MVFAPGCEEVVGRRNGLPGRRLPRKGAALRPRGFPTPHLDMSPSKMTPVYSREIPLSILQVGLAVLVSASFVGAQERQPVVDPLAPVAQSSAPKAAVTIDPLQEALVGSPIHGESTLVPIDAQDDLIPLPIPAVVRASDAGDVIEAPASGDPFFLGFAGGKRYPAPGETIDPLLTAQAQALYADGRPTQETYAFAMFQKRITPQRIKELEALGARVISFHPHYCLKIALPPIAIDQIAAYPALRWLGVQAPVQPQTRSTATFTQLCP